MMGFGCRIRHLRLVGKGDAHLPDRKQAVTEQECRNGVRCAMSDRTGVLRFEGFDIVDAPECAETVYRIREYLVGRALAETDVDYIREIGLVEHPLCARVVAELVAQSQETFSRPKEHPGKEAPPADRPAGASAATGPGRRKSPTRRHPV